MARFVRFTIPGDTNELGPNKRLHWQAERRLKEQWREKATAYFLAVSGNEHFFPKAKITFTLRRGRALDPDNAHSSRALKAIVDALKGRLFPDDKAACVSYAPLRQTVLPYYRTTPEVEVLVQEIDGEDDALAEKNPSAAPGPRED